MIHERPPAPNRNLRLLVLVMLAQICALFVRSWLQLELDRRGIPGAKHLSYLPVPLILCCLLFPLWREHGQMIRNAFERRKLSWRVAATGLALGFLMRLEFWSVLVFLAASDLSTPANAGTNPAPLMWFACPSAASLLLYLIVMSGITPVTEEIVHRGWLLPWLLPYGRWTAVVASAALFAVLHTWSGILFAFWFGLFAAVYFLNSGHLWGVLIAHASYNSLIALDWLCLNIAWQPTVRSSGLLFFQLAAAGIFVVATVVSIRLVRK